MASYSIYKDSISDEELIKCYDEAKKQFNNLNTADLDVIFSVALKNRKCFPNIVIKDDFSVQLYMNSWVKFYYNATNVLPSKRNSPVRTLSSDPAVKLLVREARNLKNDDVDKYDDLHSVFMSAENIHGNLLEEFVAQAIRPYGFYWCAGHILRGIDFCNKDGSALLLVNNRADTERENNSSLYNGKKIVKWYRIGKCLRGGERTHSFRWQVLNDFVDANKSKEGIQRASELTEEMYLKFIADVAHKNPFLIAKS